MQIYMFISTFYLFILGIVVSITKNESSPLTRISNVFCHCSSPTSGIVSKTQKMPENMCSMDEQIN